MSEQARILIVDDEPLLLSEYARVLESEGYSTIKAATGQQCFRLATEQRPDLILLDAGLPDVTSAEALRRIKSDPATADIFIINVGGSRPSAGDRADELEAAADGYLAKPVDKRSLLAQVRAFIRIKAAEAALLDQQEKEMLALGHFTSPSQASISAQLFGAGSLRQTLPEIFNEMVERYGVLLDLALEERAYKVEHNVSGGFVFLVERLGFLKAGPRDVVDIHSATLKKKAKESNPARAQAYVEEGRLTVLELMGHLLSYYRTRSMAMHRSAGHRTQQNTSAEGVN